MDEFLIKVALVTPVFNRCETTLQALRSLRRIDSTGLTVKIFIVDDGSTDGTADAINTQFPEVELISGDGSLHYAAGTNRGIERALEWNADYVVTMNDDAIFHENFLQSLVTTAQAFHKSIVGSLLLLWDEPLRVFQVAPIWSTFGGGWIFPENLTAKSISQEAFDVDCIVGNCVLFPVDAIREVGLMDEKRFPHGWGDAQYMTRMKKGGWRLLVDPKSLVWCEPNTYPRPLHSHTKREILTILFVDVRHPLNLKRQFVARWYSAPSRPKAVLSFVSYVASLVRKSIAFRSKWTSAGIDG